MKTNSNKALYKTILLLFCFFGQIVHADTPPPGVDPTPDFPINENIPILISIALVFGLYVIYKHTQNKKASI